MPRAARVTSVVEELKTARWMWCLVVVLVVGFRHLAGSDAAPIAPKFGDTDDALRLVQVRDFLIHGSWYDTRLAAIGAPEALNSHWSRLIDLPIAWLVSFFTLFTSYLRAEILAQIVWPLLLLFALARFLVGEAERRAGMSAGIVVLALLVLAPSGLFQFLPGRIDHHNAQILCAVAGLFLLQRAITEPAAGWWAGGLMALGLVVGFEALPLLAASLGIACLLACFDTRARAGACHAVIALAAGLIAGFAVTTHPAEWLMVACDELSPNLLALCGAGALGAGILLSRFRDAAAWIWIAGFAIAGAVGIGAYFATNPACAAGAFAGMDPIVKSKWLAGVVEGKTLIEFARIQPSLALGFVIVMIVALTILFRQAFDTRTTDQIFMAASTLLAGLYGFYYIKFMPYGVLLALVPLACWIARLPAIGETSSFAVRLGAVLVTSQTFFVMIAGFAIGLVSDVEADAKDKLSSSVSSCSVKSDIAALSRLPAGLIISDIDLGPYIAASTHHRAYAGPYHRIHTSIKDLLVLQTAQLSEAGRQLSRMNGDYLVLCGVEPDATKKQEKPETFSMHMRRGGSFAGLEPVSIDTIKGPLRVWKIVEAQ
ncbi:MAG: hypothetical protein ACR2PI_19810 [Hyphomicrobiaceae bacterium]